MKANFLTDEHEMFREALRKMLQKEAYPYYEKWEEEREIPREFWMKLGENGFLLPWVEEQYGGLGLDFSYSMILTEELERVGVGLASGICLHSDIVSPYIEAYGTAEQKQKWLPKSVTGEYISAIAMTEPGAGSDLAGIKTTARKEGDHYILNGEKTFITNGNHADYVVVVCKTDPHAQPAYRGISLVVVENGTPGFTRGKKLNKIGMHSGDTAELIFEDVKVPAENLLGEEGKGFYYLMDKLQQERLVVALQVQIEAEVMLQLTVDYVKERKAFGSRIADFQNTQFKLAEMATEIDMGRNYVNTLTEKHMQGEDIVKEVSMAKWWISEMAKRVAAECLQLHGGYGYMEEYEIARRYRDISVTSIYAGTTEIMKSIIAKKNTVVGGYILKLSEKKILKKKEQILLSAITIVNRRGYDGATMEEIAAELMMTKGSLYYYFHNKSDLLYQCHKLVLTKATVELEKELRGEGTAEEIMRNMIGTHIDFAVDEKETFNLIIEPKQMFNPEQIEPVLKLRKYYASLFDQAIEKGVASGEFHVKQQMIVRMMILGAMNWIQQWYNPDGTMAKEELKQHFADAIIKLLK